MSHFSDRRSRFYRLQFCVAVVGDRGHACRQSRQADLCRQSGKSGEGFRRQTLHFVHGDIGDRELVQGLLQRHQPRAIVHFAAESHVDRSIHGPDDFIRTNVNGTFNLLEEVRAYWDGLALEDESWLSLSPRLHRRGVRLARARTTRLSLRRRPTRPTAPIRRPRRRPIIWCAPTTTPTGLPTLTTNCSNNYGPYQFPEKLIPLVILNAMNGKPLPVYGDGQNVRDWLFVGDHCEAVRTVLARGSVGETYNIGGRNEKRNLEIVQTICAILDELRPSTPAVPHRKLIAFVKDRPGHDRRYAIDARKIEQ